MEIWEEIAFDRERGTKRLVAELGDRLLTAAYQITQNAMNASKNALRAIKGGTRFYGEAICRLNML